MFHTLRNCVKNFSFVAILFLIFGLNLGFANEEPTDVYSKVRVMVSAPEDISILLQSGIPVDHFTGNFETGIELVLNQREMSLLETSTFNFDVIIPDMASYYENRKAPTEAELRESERIKAADNITGFEYGSLGGFYNYNEVAQELDSMYLLYPNIITQKMNIGTTWEGRTIWAAKISDNPNTDESATESAVYYDALHHAREPASMAVLVYYMYWLLENYGTDPEATYLVDTREIFFVPVVNPDGYVYNETYPSRMWRKNRRNNTGSSCYGVDLNRNYPLGFGGIGSSGDPCSDIHRGPNAFSEPETQIVRDFVGTINPTIAFSTHSVRGAYLNPYGYTNSSPEFEVYSEFASDFASKNDYVYGRTGEILNYTSSGTTRDYLHSIGTYAWTPEIGGSGFWPSVSEIIPLVSENVYPMKYLTWVCGAFADFQNYDLLGKGYVEATDTLSLKIAVKNRGLTRPADNVEVDVSTNYPHIIPLQTTVNYGQIPARQIVSNANNPFQLILDGGATYLDEIELYVSVSQEGTVSARDTIRVTVAKTDVLFFDDAENGMANWIRGGSGHSWDTTFVDFYDGTHSFADSRYGNTANNTNNYCLTIPNIDLSNAVHPRLEFWAKWSIEEGYDFARVQISTNNGTSWTSLAGNYTIPFQGQPSYSAAEHWVQESIDLSSYIGQQVKFRFIFDTDGGVVSDGFYFDQFRVVDYTQTPVSISEQQDNLPQELSLAQNYPNPFNPTTTIHFELPPKYAGETVTLKIFNTLGQEVKTLIKSELSAGRKSIEWNGKNKLGQAVSSGVYLYSLRVGDELLTRKMLFLQ